PLELPRRAAELTRRGAGRVDPGSGHRIPATRLTRGRELARVLGRMGCERARRRGNLAEEDPGRPPGPGPAVAEPAVRREARDRHARADRLHSAGERMLKNAGS